MHEKLIYILQIVVQKINQILFDVEIFASH